jgi:hypothetical protein
MDNKPVAGAKPDHGNAGVLTGRDHGAVVSANPAGGEVAQSAYQSNLSKSAPK